MENPLKLFFTLLLKGDFINYGYADRISSEKISLYGEDITVNIWAEAEKIFDLIDKEYWKNDRDSNKYFFQKLLYTNAKLIAEAKLQLDKYIIQLIKSGDISKWLVTYNNIQTTYESLIAINQRIKNIYLEDIPEIQPYTEFQLEYVRFDEEQAESLRSKCIKNLGKKDTYFNCPKLDKGECQIIVETSTLPKNLAQVGITELNADKKFFEEQYPENNDTELKDHIFIWNDSAKSFVKFFAPVLEKHKITFKNKTSRDPIVGALHNIFLIYSEEKQGKQQTRISPITLTSYFKKEANGDPY